MKQRKLPWLISLGLIALTLGATPAFAADPAAAIKRANGHISNFPGKTLHGRDHSYEVRDVIIDADGAEHVRFDRRYKGLPVIGGDMVVHSSRNGAFSSTSHTLKRWIDMPVKPTVNAARAQQAALAMHSGSTGSIPAQQVIYARADLPALAWDIRVFGEQADGTPSEKHVIVDAHTGRVLEAWDDIHTGAAAGTGKSFFSGNVSLTTNSLTTGGFELRDPSRGGQYTTNMAKKTSGTGTIFKDADNTWGNNLLSDLATVGVDAQYGTSVTWDYFKSVHGRTGIANDGKGAYNKVHYGRAYNNAFWSDSCFCMTYGDGDGTTFNPFDSLDVAGHEMAHGVTSRTAKLIYSGESGGLNEGTSDIFGTMVEFYAANSNDVGDYLIGEKLYKTSGKSLRNMINPSTDSVSADCWYSTLGSLDVHYSSGVTNHFFYLLAEGTTAGSPSKTCTSGNTRVATGAGTLIGIGKDKAAAIWYKALTAYMTSSTNYAGARTATLNAANDLYGAGSVEANAVAAAWAAVLVN